MNFIKILKEKMGLAINAYLVRRLTTSPTMPLERLQRPVEALNPRSAEVVR
jgi:hypothetical protein